MQGTYSFLVITKTDCFVDFLTWKMEPGRKSFFQGRRVDHNMVHLSNPRFVRSCLPRGHNLDHMPKRGGGAVASRRCSLSTSVSPASSTRTCSPESSSSSPASAISPGFLSNSPLNCSRALLWVSCSIQRYIVPHSIKSGYSKWCYKVKHHI